MGEGVGCPAVGLGVKGAGARTLRGGGGGGGGLLGYPTTGAGGGGVDGLWAHSSPCPTFAAPCPHVLRVQQPFAWVATAACAPSDAHHSGGPRVCAQQRPPLSRGAVPASHAGRRRPEPTGTSMAEAEGGGVIGPKGRKKKVCAQEGGGALGPPFPDPPFRAHVTTG